MAASGHVPDGEPYIDVQWATALEMDLVGFRIWRSVTGDRADAQLMTEALIAGRGTPATGAEYRYRDGAVKSGIIYTYWLQEVTGSGIATDLQSTSAQVLDSLYLPLIAR